MSTSKSIVIELSTEQVARLDQLRGACNVSRSELVAELIEHAKPTRRARRSATGRQPVNPWAQVWP